MSGRAEGSGWEAVAAEIVVAIAHDLNNRLLALTGVRELGESGLDADLRALFDEELARLEEISRLLRRLGQSEGAVETVEGEWMLRGAREMAARHPAVRRVGARWSLAEELPAITIDPLATERALVRTVVACALAAAAAGRKVSISASEDGGALVVVVEPAPPGADAADALRAAGATVWAGDGALHARFAPG